MFANVESKKYQYWAYEKSWKNKNTSLLTRTVQYCTILYSEQNSWIEITVTIQVFIQKRRHRLRKREVHDYVKRFLQISNSTLFLNVYRLISGTFPIVRHGSLQQFMSAARKVSTLIWIILFFWKRKGIIFSMKREGHVFQKRNHIVTAYSFITNLVYSILSHWPVYIDGSVYSSGTL